MNMKTEQLLLFLGLLFLGLVDCSEILASEPQQLRNRLEKSVGEASRVGKVTEAWQTERQQLIEEIQNLELKTAWTEFRLEKTEKWLASEKNNIETLTQNLSRAAATREHLAPLLEVFYADLEAHVLSDLPFLGEERRRRLAHIRSTLDSPKSQLSDKMGQLFEAMRVEVDYGYTVDVTEKLVKNRKGEIVQATVFRLGRLSLFRLLADDSVLERYDSEQGNWHELSDNSIFEIEKAIEIARKKRVSTLLFLPVDSINASPPKTVEAQ